VDEGLSPCLDLLLRFGVNHVGVVGRDFLVQPVWRVSDKVAVLVQRAALNRRVGSKRCERVVKARPAIDTDKCFAFA
jgi:hypothetical protein